METIYFNEWKKNKPADRFAQTLEEFAREKELSLAWKELDETRAKYPEYFAQTSSASAGKMQEEIERIAPEAIRVFSQKADGAMMRFLAALPKRLGLNETLFARLLPAAMLNRIQGPQDVEALINFYKAEHDVFPERQEARTLIAQREHKKRIEEAYAAAGLSAQAVFELLGTPIGPERGFVMRAVYDAVADPDSHHDFGQHTSEIVSRARRVKQQLISIQ